MSNTELENVNVSDVQPGPKDRQTERRPFGVTAKARQSKRLSTRPHVKSRDSSRSSKQTQAAQAGTKQDPVIQMLGRRAGVSVDDVVAKTGWQPHSVRGFLSGVVRKKLGLSLVSEAGKDGVRRYHLAPVTSPKV